MWWPSCQVEIRSMTGRHSEVGKIRRGRSPDKQGRHIATYRTPELENPGSRYDILSMTSTALLEVFESVNDVQVHTVKTGIKDFFQV